MQGFEAAGHLFIQCADVRRKEAVQGEGAAFGVDECGAFIEERVTDQIETGEMGSEGFGHRGRLTSGYPGSGEDTFRLRAAGIAFQGASLFIF